MGELKVSLDGLNSKGFISTLMVLIVVTSLFSYVNLYFNTQNERNNYFNSLMNSKLSYAENDLKQSYLQSQGIDYFTLDIDENNQTVYNLETDINVSTGKSYSDDFQKFKNYFEVTYDSYNNYEANLNFSQTFTLHPYETDFSYQGENFYIHTDNYSAIEEIKVVTTAHNERTVTNTTTPTSDGSGYPLITAVIKNDDGDVLVDDSVNQDPADTNTSDDFLCNFTGRHYRIFFGDTGSPGTLQVDGSEVPGTVEQISITYQSTKEKVFISSPGKYSIEGVQDYLKTSEMVISRVRHG